MFNNYFHDFATAAIVVCTLIMFFAVEYAEGGHNNRLKEKVLAIYPRMLHLTGGTFVLLIMAGIVRSFTYKWYEWVDVLGDGQVFLLIFKHVLMFGAFGYAVYLWVGIHKKINAMRKVT